MPKPRLKNYPNRQSREGHVEARLYHKEISAHLDACVLHSGKIRLDIWEDKERTPCSVRVNIREEQSFHAAMILMPNEVYLLKLVHSESYKDQSQTVWDTHLAEELILKGLIEGPITAINELSYDLSGLKLTKAGQYILDRAKERGNV